MAKESRAPTVRKRSRTGLAALVVAALAVGVYANSLSNGFTFDDNLVIVNNPRAWQWPGIEAFFTPEYFDLTPELSYRPVCTLSYYFDFYVLNAGRREGRAAAHHLSSILIHAANAVLLLYLLRSLGFSLAAAFAACALFAVHPVATEAVNAIGFREDLLALGFVLGALFCRQRALTSGERKRWLVAMAILAALGALSKETAVLAPALALLCDAARGFPPRERKPRWTTIFALGAVAAAYMAVRFGPMGRALEGELQPWGGGRGYALLGAANVMLQYGRLMLAPVGLCLEHTPPSGRELGIAGAAPGLLFVVLYMILTLRMRRRAPRAFFGLGWIGLWLLPVAHLVPIANPMAERFLYGPLAGLCMLLGLAFGATPARHRRVLLLLLIVCFGALTVRRNPLWRHERALYMSAVRCNPASARAQNNLGDVYRIDLADDATREGFRAMAAAQFRHALRQDPDADSALYNLGLVWSLRGDYARALPYALKAVRLIDRGPAFPWTVAKYHHQLGVVYWNLKERAAALRHLRIAAETDPKNRKAREDFEKVEKYMRKRRGMNAE